MRIAICDDNKRDTAFLRDIIMQKNESVVIDCYESGADFLAAQQELSHDLVFMDIYLNGENGIDVIRKMREIPSQTEVVFTTVSDEHAVDAISVRALHYLVKPFGEEDVAECMHRMKNASSSIHEESKLTIRIGNDMYTLDQRDIERVEASDHKTNIFMHSGSVYSIWMMFRKPTLHRAQVSLKTASKTTRKTQRIF